ncbi:MAG: helix-turn-helix domain-containing protein [Myxococcota bacterium]
MILPALRDRLDDVPLLIQKFLKDGRFNRDTDGNQRVTAISRATLDRLMSYQWPGNVRELHNVVERAVSFADSETMEVRDLPDHIASMPALAGSVIPAETSTEGTTPGGLTPPTDGNFKDAKEAWVAAFEKDYIEELLRRNDGNISHAAREADIDRKYFRKLMKKYDLR